VSQYWNEMSHADLFDILREFSEIKCKQFPQASVMTWW